MSPAARSAIKRGQLPSWAVQTDENDKNDDVVVFFDNEGSARRKNSGKLVSFDV